MINNPNTSFQNIQMQNQINSNMFQTQHFQKPLSGASAIVGFDIDKYLDGEGCTFQNTPNCNQTSNIHKKNGKPDNIASIVGAALLSSIATASAILLFKRH